MTKPGTKESFEIEYLDTVVSEDIPALPKTIRIFVKVLCSKILLT
jgi:hypothetical protein